jgi:hypothetical protein
MPLIDHYSSSIVAQGKETFCPGSASCLNRSASTPESMSRFRFEYCPPGATLYLTELMVTRWAIGNKAIIAIRETAHFVYFLFLHVCPIFTGRVGTERGVLSDLSTSKHLLGSANCSDNYPLAISPKVLGVFHVTTAR